MGILGQIIRLLASRPVCAAAITLIVLPAIAATASQPDGGDSESRTILTLLNEQVLLIATVVGAIATLPALIEFLIDRRKRKERIALSLEDLEVSALKPRLAGMDDLLAGIADLIDRAGDPHAYAGLAVGNEILIIGTNLSGKKSFAQRVAKEARLDRLITVYNPRNGDALAKAKSLVQSYSRQKIMLLLPRIDEVFEQEDEELLSELEALIETTSELENVQVIGTAVEFEPDSALDNAFGIKIVLPGTPQSETAARQVNPHAQHVLAEVTRFYLERATAAGYRLNGISAEEFRQRVLETVGNPAEIEDIVVLCQTMAVHRRRTGAAPDLLITPQILQTAISRVIVGAVHTKGAQ